MRAIRPTANILRVVILVPGHQRMEDVWLEELSWNVAREGGPEGDVGEAMAIMHGEDEEGARIRREV